MQKNITMSSFFRYLTENFPDARRYKNNRSFSEKYVWKGRIIFGVQCSLYDVYVNFYLSLRRTLP